MAQVEEELWQRAIDYFHVGKVVFGDVCEIAHYGFFIELKHPDVEEAFTGLVSITEFADFVSVEMSDFPGIGDNVKAVVLGHRSHNQQVWLSTKESHFAESESES